MATSSSRPLSRDPDAVASTGFVGSLGHASDTSLMLGVTRRRHAALAEVYGRHSGPVHAQARRACGASMADDVVQEVFLRLWQHPAAFDAERGSLRSYLLTVAYSRSIDSIRSDAARRRREALDPTPSVDSGSAPSLDAGEDTWRLLDSLSEPQREVITLAYVHGHTYAEVATLLGRPLGTVKSRMRAGLEVLRVLLSDDESRPSAVVGLPHR